MKKFRRILVKISGEALSGTGSGVHSAAVQSVATQLKDIASTGVQLAVVVGGGNFWRGRTSPDMDRVTADNVGMLATVMNALVLGDALSQLGVRNRVFSALPMPKVAETHNVLQERALLEEGCVVIYGGGTGAPFFSTDTATVLRACEINADAVFFAKAIDGVYDSDPATNKNAKKYDEITFDKVIKDNLKVLDLTAAAMCREFGISAVCFSKEEKNGILRILNGEKLGTIIH